MAISPEARTPVVGHPDHGFHVVRIKDVIRETADASSFTLDVPEDLQAGFAYRAGQFVTFRVAVDDGTLLRCYSMSSAPGIDQDLRVTVKRVPGGRVSNWMIDRLHPGDAVEVTFPAGVFCLGTGDGDVVAFAAGSGITPVLSIVKRALATTRRRVRLLYANRDRESVIFAEDLDGLVGAHSGRLEVSHHLDVERGFLTADTVRSFVDGASGDDHFLCGPPPFMDIVEAALIDHGIDQGTIRVERFSPDAPPPPDPGPVDPGPADEVQVTIALNGRTATADHRAGTTILQTARQMGMAPPFSCEAGNCATCMARVLEGTVTMRTNNALTDDEVEEGWVLTCQAVPTSPAVHVTYEED